MPRDEKIATDSPENTVITINQHSLTSPKNIFWFFV